MRFLIWLPHLYRGPYEFFVRNMTLLLGFACVSFMSIIIIRQYESTVKIYHQSHVDLNKSLGFTQQTKKICKPFNMLSEAQIYIISSDMSHTMSFWNPVVAIVAKEVLPATPNIWKP